MVLGRETSYRSRARPVHSLDSNSHPQTKGRPVKFTIHKSVKNGQFWFRVVASNGQIMATSEMYSAKASAVNAIESIQKSAGAASIVDESAAK